MDTGFLVAIFFPGGFAGADVLGLSSPLPFAGVLSLDLCAVVLLSGFLLDEIFFEAADPLLDFATGGTSLLGFLSVAFLESAGFLVSADGLVSAGFLGSTAPASFIIALVCLLPGELAKSSAN